MTSLPDNYDELELDEKFSLLHKFGGTGDYARGYNNAIFACRKVLLAHDINETLKDKPTLNHAAQIAQNEALNPPSGWPFDENIDKEIGWTLAAKHIFDKIKSLENGK